MICRCSFSYQTATYALITAETLVPGSVNGDIAIQWEWSTFDPLQIPNPLTDYDKTLHSWLCPRDEHGTKHMCLSAVRKRLAKYVKYKASLFYFLFSPESPTEVTLGISRTKAQNFTHEGSKHALWRKEVPFWGPHDGRLHFGVEFPHKPPKGPFLGTIKPPRTASRRIRHRRLTSLASLRPLAEWRILFIASWKSSLFCIFQWLQRNDSVSWRTIFGKEIQFLQNSYSISSQSVSQIVA